MKHLVMALALIVLLTGCSKDKETIGQPIDPQAKVVRLQEVLKSPQIYDGQTLVIEGNFSGACCASDFIFKDGVASTEVFISKECPMPSGTKVGSRMRVYGTVAVKEEQAEGNESANSFVAIQAKGMEVLQ